MTIINMVGGGGSPIPGLEGEYTVTTPTSIPWGAMALSHSGTGGTQGTYVTNTPRVNLTGGSVETMNITAPISVSAQHAQYTHSVSTTEYSETRSVTSYFNGPYVYNKTTLDVDNISPHIKDNSEGVLKCTLYSYKGSKPSYPYVTRLGVKMASKSSAGNGSDYTSVTSITLPFNKSGSTIKYSFNKATPTLKYTVLIDHYRSGDNSSEYMVIVVDEITYT